jgi:diaminopimelate decarboxylase
MTYDKKSVEELLKTFGSPLYIFNEQGFIDNYHSLESAMRCRYKRYRIAYSFKTNYTPYICRTAKVLGAYAEVVSGMEYEIAKRIGYEDRNIIFNGPEKGRDGIKAFLKGALINADSIDEVICLCRTATEHPERDFRIGIRINLDVGQGFISRFGMEEQDAVRAFKMVKKIRNLQITGLHCHISRCRNLDAWRKRTEIMLDLADRLFSSIPEYLDLGSGMFGSMAPEFAAQFNDIPTYEEYAEVTAGLVSRHYETGKGPVLFTEPGTTLVNRFVDCIARVDSIKRIGSKHFAVLDASEHILGETCILKKLPAEVVACGAPQTEYESIDLTGYTCLEQDVLLSGFKGSLAKGDYVVFGNAGGYSNVLKPPFIRPGCAMAAERSDGSFCLIKKAETPWDIISTYIF